MAEHSITSELLNALSPERFSRIGSGTPELLNALSPKALDLAPRSCRMLSRHRHWIRHTGAAERSFRHRHWIRPPSCSFNPGFGEILNYISLSRNTSDSVFLKYYWNTLQGNPAVRKTEMTAKINLQGGKPNPVLKTWPWVIAIPLLSNRALHWI